MATAPHGAVLSSLLLIALCGICLARCKEILVLGSTSSQQYERDPLAPDDGQVPSLSATRVILDVEQVSQTNYLQRGGVWYFQWFVHVQGERLHSIDISLYKNAPQGNSTCAVSLGDHFEPGTRIATSDTVYYAGQWRYYTYHFSPLLNLTVGQNYSFCVILPDAPRCLIHTGNLYTPGRLGFYVNSTDVWGYYTSTWDMNFRVWTTLTVECTVDTDCLASDPCINDTCSNYTCFHEFVYSETCQCLNDSDCDDHQNCSSEYCNVPTYTCIRDTHLCPCSTNADCIDFDSCTEDVCLANWTCSNQYRTLIRYEDVNTDPGYLYQLQLNDRWAFQTFVHVSGEVLDYVVVSLYRSSYVGYINMTLNSGDHYETGTVVAESESVYSVGLWTFYFFDFPTKPAMTVGETYTVCLRNPSVQNLLFHDGNLYPSGRMGAYDYVTDTWAYLNGGYDLKFVVHTISGLNYSACECNSVEDCLDSSNCTDQFCDVNAHQCGYNLTCGCAYDSDCASLDECTRGRCNATGDECAFSLGAPESVLDVSVAHYDDYDSRPHWPCQQFTHVAGDNLDVVSVALMKYGITQNIVCHISAGSSLALDDLLASSNPTTYTGQWKWYNFSFPTRPALIAGEMYTFCLAGPERMHVLRVTSDSYSGGRMGEYDNSTGIWYYLHAHVDMTFAVYAIDGLGFEGCGCITNADCPTADPCRDNRCVIATHTCNDTVICECTEDENCTDLDPCTLGICLRSNHTCQQRSICNCTDDGDCSLGDPCYNGTCSRKIRPAVTPTSANVARTATVPTWKIARWTYVRR